MSLSAPMALVAFFLLTGGAQAAKPPRLPDCGTVQQRLELSAEPNTQAHEVCISPGLATMFLFFEGELAPTGVALEGAGRFMVMEMGKRTLSLLPSDKVLPGERLKLTVLFAGGEAPAMATFLLVVHPARAPRQVEVFRHKRTLASYQQAEKEHAAQLHQCHAEKEQLLAESGGPGGLTGLVATKRLGKEGVTSRHLTLNLTRQPASARGPEVQEAWSYRAHGVVAVELWLVSPEGAAPWVAQGAELVVPGRRPLRVLSLWQEAVPSPTPTMRVVIEAETTGAELSGSFTLKVWNEEGTGSFKLTGVSFQ